VQFFYIIIYICVA